MPWRKFKGAAELGFALASRPVADAQALALVPVPGANRRDPLGPAPKRPEPEQPET